MDRSEEEHLLLFMAYLMYTAQGNSRLPAQPVDSETTMLVAAPHRAGSDLFAGRRVGYAFSARVAIRRSCDLAGLGPGTEVLAPAYNCGSELDPILHAGATVRLYPVSEDLQTDPSDVERMIGPATRAIYVTHYFGFPNPAAGSLRALCNRHGLRLIEDCALSLLSGPHPADGRSGDVSIFCFYKFFPFPVVRGGALVVNAHDLGAPTFPRPAPEVRVARQALRQAAVAVPGLKTLRQALKRRSLPAEADIQGMPADYYFDPDLKDRAISRLTRAALGRIDIGEVAQRRRENYMALASALQGLPGLAPLWPELPDDTVPLGLPLRIKERNRLARELTARGIPVPLWWAGRNLRLDWACAGGADGLRLKAEMLLLPVDQGRSRRDMEMTAVILSQLMTTK